MGEARRRGTFEERKKLAQDRNALELEDRNKRINAKQKELKQAAPFVKCKKHNKAIMAHVLMAGLGIIKNEHI